MIFTFDNAASGNQIFQWDSGLYLEVTGNLVSEGGHTYAHFQHSASDEILSLEVEDGRVAIPNILLQTAGVFRVYCYVNDAEYGKTLVEQMFVIVERPMPPEYIYDPTPVITYPELVDLVDDLTALRDALSNVSASAETLPAGSAASAEATLSPDGLAFVFGIPQGEQGERGEQGEQGEQGERGEQGIPGKDGKDAVVDPTLSHAGEAADAKATGDALADKVDEVAGKGLSTNDYTNTDKNKVDHISIEADHGSAYNKVIIQTDKPETERVFFELRTNDGYESDIYAEFGTIVDDEEEIQPLLIKGVATPTASNDAANKGYVDSAIATAIGAAIGGSY